MNATDEPKKLGRPTRFPGKTEKLGVTVTPMAIEMVKAVQVGDQITGSDAAEELIRRGHKSWLDKRRPRAKKAGG